MTTCKTSWNDGKDVITEEGELFDSDHTQFSILESINSLIVLQEINNAYLEAIVGYKITEKDTKNA